MNHKWQKQPDKLYDGIGWFKISICNVCGCRKELLNQRFAEPNYIRNKQIYDHYIECVDLELENSKTID